MGFAQGLSGVNAASKMLQVLGNNIANSKTVGFKSADTQFSEMMGTSTRVEGTKTSFAQTSVSMTGNDLDMAVVGQGFFVLESKGSPVYTRNGEFQMDKDGFVVTTRGDYMTGKQVDDSGNVVDVTGRLRINQTSKPSATSSVGLNVSMDSTTLVRTTSSTTNKLITAVGDFFNETGTVKTGVTYDAFTALQAYDSLGNTHTMNMYFQRGPAEAYSVDDGSGAVTNKTYNVWYMMPSLDGYKYSDSGTMTPILETVGSTGTHTAITAPLKMYFEGDKFVNMGSVPTTLTTTNPATTVSPTGVAGTAQVETIPLSAFGPGRNYSLAVDATAAAAVTLTASEPATLDELVSKLQADADYAGSGVTIAKNGTTGITITHTATGEVGANSAMTLNYTKATAIDYGTFVSLGAHANFNKEAEPILFSLNMADSSMSNRSFGVMSQKQDGYTSGTVNGISVDKEGIIMARYTNGVSEAQGKVILKNFTNLHGLGRTGDGYYIQTTESGEPIDSGVGTLQSGALEDSNVDVTTEMVSLLDAQRMYQANAQTLKVEDAIFNVLANMR